MCGLAGVVHLDGSPVESAVLQRMGAALCHRGPDAEGIHEDHAGRPAVGLVHRRLSIIDLSAAANQPLGGEDGRVLVMLNGEIYNFRELRASLRRATPSAPTAHQVIAHGYEDRGEEIVPRLDGMFAVPSGTRARRLVLARDGFGKPLYYWSDARRRVRIRDQGALAAACPRRWRTSTSAIPRLRLRADPRDVLQGIRKPPPASLMVVDARGRPLPRLLDLTYPPEGGRRLLDEAAGTCEAAPGRGP